MTDFPNTPDIFVSQKALDIHNKLFNTNLSGDFEGYLHIKLPGYSISIYSSGDIISILSDDLKDCVYYPSEFFDDAKKKIISIIEQSPKEN